MVMIGKGGRGLGMKHCKYFLYHIWPNKLKPDGHFFDLIIYYYYSITLIVLLFIVPACTTQNLRGDVDETSQGLHVSSGLD